jgi:hypothetical protein
MGATRSRTIFPKCNFQGKIMTTQFSPMAAIIGRPRQIVKVLGNMNKRYW